MPNTLALIVLLGWPLVAALFFRKLPVPAALCWSIVGGYLLIPTRVEIDLPLLPALDKTLMPSLAAAVMCVIAAKAQNKARRQARQARTDRPEPRAAVGMRHRQTVPVPNMAFRHSRGGVAFKLLLLLVVATPFFTVLTNKEALYYGPTYLSGLRLYDSFSMVLEALVVVLPFLLARRYLATPQAHVTLMRVLCLAALAYSLLALFEIRMSPQLNRWVYGFFPSSFAQHIRNGGFRPLVFLEHGLRLGIFLSMAILSAVAVWRQTRAMPSVGYLLAVAWLFMTLVLSKNLGALGITFMLLPIAAFLGVRGQMLIAAGLAAVVLLYPMLRGSNLIPVENVYSLAQSVSEERAQSLKTRLDNEDALLEHASRKPLFGWGKWGRSRLFDPRSGRDISTTDGVWVIVIGTSGWFGYVGTFGLLTLPILLLGLRRKTLGLSLVSSGLALVLAADLVDLIPNSGLTPVTWLVAGALAGRYEVAPATGVGQEPQPNSRRAGARGVSSRRRSPRDLFQRDAREQRPL